MAFEATSRGHANSKHFPSTVVVLHQILKKIKIKIKNDRTRGCTNGFITYHFKLIIEIIHNIKYWTNKRKCSVIEIIYEQCKILSLRNLNGSLITFPCTYGRTITTLDT